MFLKKIDIFKFRPKLYVNDSEFGFSTKLGGVMSILIGILTTLAIFAFGMELVDKTAPTTNISEAYLENPKLDNDLFIGFQFVRSGLTPFYNAEKYLSFSFNIYKTIMDENNEMQTQYIVYQPVKCKDEDKLFLDEENNHNLTSYLLSNSTENLYCKSPLIEEKLKGEKGNGEFISYALFVKRCRNTTTQSICAPEDEVTAVLDSMMINIVISNVFINPTNLNDPLENTYYSYFSVVSQKLQKKEIIKFQNIEFFTDEAFLLEDFKQTNSVKFDSIITDFSYSDTTLYHGIFTLSKAKRIYTRSYVKVQKVAANVGGIISFFFKVFDLLMIITSKVSFLKYLKNTILKEINIYKSNNQTLIQQEHQHHQKIKTNKDIINMNSKSPENDFRSNNNSQSFQSFHKINIIKNSNIGQNSNIEDYMTKKNEFKNNILMDSNKNINDSINIKTKKENNFEIMLEENRRISDNRLNNFNIKKKPLFTFSQQNVLSKAKSEDIRKKENITRIENKIVSQLNFSIKNAENSSSSLNAFLGNHLNLLSKINKTDLISKRLFIKDILDYYFLSNANSKLLNNINNFYSKEYSIENMFQIQNNKFIIENILTKITEREKISQIFNSKVSLCFLQEKNY